jgi:hypothetical protein
MNRVMPFAGPVIQGTTSFQSLVADLLLPVSGGGPDWHNSCEDRRMRTRKPQRAAGTRTMKDVLRGWLFHPKSEADIQALAEGQKRLVRCYIQPGTGETRKQWKPGYLTASRGALRWVGSSKRWSPLDFTAGEWTAIVRGHARVDHVYASFGILVCSRMSEERQIAVPRPDVNLCLFALTGQV